MYKQRKNIQIKKIHFQIINKAQIKDSKSLKKINSNFKEIHKIFNNIKLNSNKINIIKMFKFKQKKKMKKSKLII